MQERNAAAQNTPDAHREVGTGRTRGRPRVMTVPDRVERIFDALHAVYESAGMDGTTMDAIAAEAGMSKRTLYGLFADRDELLGAYMERMRRDFVRDLDPADLDLPLEGRLRRLLGPCPRTGPPGLPVAVLRVALAGAETGPRTARACLSRWVARDRSLIRDELDRAVARGEAHIPDTARAAVVLESMVRPSAVDLLLDPGAVPGDADLGARFESGLAMFLRAVAPR